MSVPSGRPLDRLLERLPHGAPFRFVSEVTRLEGGIRAELGSEPRELPVNDVPEWSGVTSTTSGAPPAGERLIEGLWRIIGDEWFLRGHFPDRPLVPGVLIMEALAQLAGILLHADAQGESGVALRGEGRLALVEGRFLREVAPPVELRLCARIGTTLGRLGLFEVEATVQEHSGDVVVARGRIALQAGGAAGADEVRW